MYYPYENNKMSKTIKCRKGAAAVEFAIVAPLLFTIMFGIIEFGLLFFDKAIVTNASREGARYGILFYPDRPVTTQAEAHSEIEARVLSYTANHLVTFGVAAVPVVTTSWSDGWPGSSGDYLTVTVTYPYDFLLLPNFITSLSNVSTLTARTIMRLE
jgi:Flp pilus assembly protein TadG